MVKQPHPMPVDSAGGLAIAPQLVGNNGLDALRAAIAEPERYAIEPKVDGVRGLVAFDGDRIMIRNRKGHMRERWLACQPFRHGLERLGAVLPIVRDGTVLDGELTTGSFHRTMAVLRGAWPFEASLRLVVFDLPNHGAVSGCYVFREFASSEWSMYAFDTAERARVGLVPVDPATACSL